jgi:hypothetical protein
MTKGNRVHRTPSVRAAPYGIRRHNHLFAAWAASRAASVNGCRFSVEQGRKTLEASGFGSNFSEPAQLPSAKRMDKKHWEWRARVIRAAKKRGLSFTDGVAAKLINCYLKVRFVCGGHHKHERVCNLHPPIDRGLLKSLATRNDGGYAKEWRQLGRVGWSKFNAEQYEHGVALIRKCLKGKPLWMIEKHWKGNQ